MSPFGIQDIHLVAQPSTRITYYLSNIPATMMPSRQPTDGPHLMRAKWRQHLGTLYTWHISTYVGSVQRNVVFISTGGKKKLSTCMVCGARLEIVYLIILYMLPEDSNQCQIWSQCQRPGDSPQHLQLVYYHHINKIYYNQWPPKSILNITCDVHQSDQSYRGPFFHNQQRTASKNIYLSRKMKKGESGRLNSLISAPRSLPEVCPSKRRYL